MVPPIYRSFFSIFPLSVYLFPSFIYIYTLPIFYSFFRLLSLIFTLKMNVTNVCEYCVLSVSISIIQKIYTCRYIHNRWYLNYKMEFFFIAVADDFKLESYIHNQVFRQLIFEFRRFCNVYGYGYAVVSFTLMLQRSCTFNHFHKKKLERICFFFEIKMREKNNFSIQHIFRMQKTLHKKAKSITIESIVVFYFDAILYLN